MTDLAAYPEREIERLHIEVLSVARIDRDFHDNIVLADRIRKHLSDLIGRHHGRRDRRSPSGFMNWIILAARAGRQPGVRSGSERGEQDPSGYTKAAHDPYSTLS